MQPNHHEPENAFWRRIAAERAEYPGVLLLNRCGDFFESYDHDAETLARVLKCETSFRGKHALTVFPHQMLRTNLEKLARAGLRVAMYEVAV